MKGQIGEMFAQVKMPMETEETIRKAMAQGEKPKTRGRNSWAVRLGTLAAVLALVVTISPEVRAAARDFVKRYVLNGGRVVIETHEDGVSGEIYGSSMDYYVERREDGHLYFIGNGENMDITDEISMEKPFLYAYADEQGLEHWVIVGGTPDNYGLQEFYRDTSEDIPRWMGGIGENYLDMETQKAYPWLAVAWEELDIPWSMPGE